MTQLRKQLDAGRAEHESAKYPGDLARDVRTMNRATDQRDTLGYIGRAVRVGLAIAAVLAIAHIGRSMLQTKPTAVATNTTYKQPTVNPPKVAGAETAIGTTESTGSPEATEADTTPLSLSAISVPSWSDVETAQSDDQTVANNLSWPAMPSFPSIDQIDASSAEKTLGNDEDSQ